MTFTQIPLSLYIHYPWCIKKCPYCDFNSYTLTKPLPEQEYIQALLRDLKNDLSIIKDRSIISIFLGGGTPSLFSAKNIEILLTNINKFIKFDSNIEITLEANPSTIEQKYLTDYKSAGINRISLGVQSFQDSRLKALGRIHSTYEINKALEKIITTNFNSFNIDIIHGLPYQKLEEALLDLKTALSFYPQHLSWYQLTIEPNTFFYNNVPDLPDEEACWQINIQGKQILAQAGFEHYEVSAFSKPNYNCTHNINYWTFGDYLGIGAGSHSKITDINTNTVTRFCKQNNPDKYLWINQDFIVKHEIVSPTQLPFEFMLNALRLTKGFKKYLFEKRTGLPLSKIDVILNKAYNFGLLETSNDYIKPTDKGQCFLDDLILLFYDYS